MMKKEKPGINPELDPENLEKISGGDGVNVLSHGYSDEDDDDDDRTEGGATGTW